MHPAAKKKSWPAFKAESVPEGQCQQHYCWRKYRKTLQLNKSRYLIVVIRVGTAQLHFTFDFTIGELIGVLQMNNVGVLHLLNFRRNIFV